MILMILIITVINNSIGHVIGKSILLQVTPRDTIIFQRIHISKFQIWVYKKVTIVQL